MGRANIDMGFHYGVSLFSIEFTLSSPFQEHLLQSDSLYDKKSRVSHLNNQRLTWEYTSGQPLLF
jgi:hypothetical protein